ncbi:GDSL esterase/lipase At3g26430-like isoform X1 [Cornus florida]|uniref:GDSL esterase/lipase At3g26430-like isoform X1 n=1 Tax=Cornus florida TaxID=4283 RepID=UPI00289B84E0|nr:GDSL esterase/lipase At3g26430-like isoform X1 [Cornus florida]
MECPTMTMSAFSLSCFCVFLLCYATVLNPVSAIQSCDFPAIFYFGDSNSDTGGLAAAFGGLAAAFDGETFFRMPAGRLSDGRLIIDFIGNGKEVADDFPPQA